MARSSPSVKRSSKFSSAAGRLTAARWQRPTPRRQSRSTPTAAFFALVDLVKADAEEVADLLVTKYKIAVVPSTSGGQNSLRIAFCSVSEKDIPRLVESVLAAVKEKS